MKWTITADHFDPEKITACENRFLIGNGYCGVRGSLDEFRADRLPAVNLAGVYDQVGEAWREPVNAPNGLFTELRVDGSVYALPETSPETHEQTLDFCHGILRRGTTWKNGNGTVTVTSERIAHKSRQHLLLSSWTVTADYAADLEILTGIDCAVWDINGPHLESYAGLPITDENAAGNGWYAAGISAVTHEKRIKVAEAEAIRVKTGAGSLYRVSDEITETGRYHRISVRTIPGESVRVEKRVTIFTDEDPDRTAAAVSVKGTPEHDGDNANVKLLSVEEAAAALLREAENIPEEELMREHREAWDALWKNAEVRIAGDERAEFAVNYSIYHLLSIAPKGARGRSIPARGLSGQTYKGAVFWDTEMFMLDLFCYTDPEVARSLVRYRIDTLPGARKKAAEYGLSGAFYAWESQEGGIEGCSDYNVTDIFTGRPQRTYFRDKQIHISAAVVYGLLHYMDITGDRTLLAEGGAEMIVECAEFFDSLLIRKAHSDVYELRDVIGPDEYHEHVDNNAYTNRMAAMTLEAAVGVLGEDTLWERISPAKSEAAELQSMRTDAERAVLRAVLEDDLARLKQQIPDEEGIIPQFDGYRSLEDVRVEDVRSRLLDPREYWGGAYGVASQTQVIKQADVIAMMNLFPEEYDEEILKKNWEFYEPRTEHGSSLSACMYGIGACMIGMPDRAYPFFIKSAEADIVGGGKEWAGGIYIGGTHPAAEGGAYMLLLRGFAGLTLKEEGPEVQPRLPQGWEEIRFRIICRGKAYEVCAGRGESSVTEITV